MEPLREESPLPVYRSRKFSGVWAYTPKKENRLGFAVLLKSYEFLGRPPFCKTEVPSAAVAYLARQVGQSQKTFHRYQWKSRIWKHHLSLVRKHCGTRRHRAKDRHRLFESLSARGNELLTRERMLQAAVDWCRGQHVELPVEAEMLRLVRSARRHFFSTVFQSVHKRLEQPVRERLDGLLCKKKWGHPVKPGISIETVTLALGLPPGLSSPIQEIAASFLERCLAKTQLPPQYERLKQLPGKSGPKTLLRELDKLRTIRAIGIRPREHLGGINPSIVQRFYKRARKEAIGLMGRHPDPVRHTLLAAFLHQRGMEESAKIWGVSWP